MRRVIVHDWVVSCNIWPFVGQQPLLPSAISVGICCPVFRFSPKNWGKSITLSGSLETDLILGTCSYIFTENC